MMDQTGPFSASIQSLTSRADWVIICLIGLLSLVAEGMAFLHGFYWDSGKWFLGVLGCHFAALVIWVTLLFMPLIDPRKGRLALRLTIRVGLLFLAFSIWRLPTWIIQTPSYVLGCKKALESKLSDSDFDFIRHKITEKIKQNPDHSLFQPETADLPPAFSLLNRPLPNYIKVHSNSANAVPEILVEWGSSLVGRHGLVIDPVETPQIDKQEDGNGVVVWHYQLANGVFFYASSD